MSKQTDKREMMREYQRVLQMEQILEGGNRRALRVWRNPKLNLEEKERLIKPISREVVRRVERLERKARRLDLGQ